MSVITCGFINDFEYDVYFFGVSVINSTLKHME